MELQDFISSLSSYDLLDLPKVFNEFVVTYQNTVKKLNVFNDYLTDLCMNYRKSLSTNYFLKVGVYHVFRGKKLYVYYHLVSDMNYIFDNVINSTWYLINEFELSIKKPLRVNRFVVDLEYFISRL